jgi:hypothetical protein
VLLAAPIVALTAATQLGLAAAGQRVMLQARQPALPWISLAAELAAWSALALAVGAMLGRTRWHDVSSVVTVPLTLATIAVLAQLPWQLFPAAIGTHAASLAWARAGWRWAVVCAASLGVIALSSRDPWLRDRPRDIRLSSGMGIGLV